MKIRDRASNNRFKFTALSPKIRCFFCPHMLVAGTTAILYMSKTVCNEAKPDLYTAASLRLDIREMYVDRQSNRLVLIPRPVYRTVLDLDLVQNLNLSLNGNGYKLKLKSRKLRWVPISRFWTLGLFHAQL